MGEDEEATVRTITAYREAPDSVVQKHRGRVVDSSGDNILAEFASVLDAVRGAVEIQNFVQLNKMSILSEVRFGICYGVSNNKGRFWDISNARKEIGYDPEDDASVF